MPTQPKLGRPPKPRAEKYAAIVAVKMTLAERRAIRAAANGSVSAWARRVLLRAAKWKG